MRKLLPLLAALFVSYSALAAGLLDANTASLEDMAALPHMDETLAKAVVDRRPFMTIGDLDALLSADLGEEELVELYAHLFVPVNLNTAGESDILLIPGVGKKMAHEFEEYRPYSSIEQFRREIGKYVDDAEVARLEMYVTLD
ncbi:MAG: helix-hairpin-helix domain-containing protein [Gammaproteobacteria bacterium]|nr:helix-hairpin-helix domain-containing protein [Gammaproteobacteria bacterium]MDH5345189.1 helix-hairpin-helix domain-containing protein [Gammaproteobacteria bacterium]